MVDFVYFQRAEDTGAEKTCKGRGREDMQGQGARRVVVTFLSKPCRQHSTMHLQTLRNCKVANSVYTATSAFTNVASVSKCGHSICS